VSERRAKKSNKYTSRSIFESLDIVGFCLFAPAAIQFLLALEWGGTTYTWKSATVIGLFCVSVGTLAVFLAWEYHRGDTAMIPLSLMKQRVVWSSFLTIFFLFANLMTSTYYLAIYFQAVKGKTPTMSGVDILPNILSSMFMAVLVVWKPRYVGADYSLELTLTFSSRTSWLLSSMDRHLSSLDRNRYRSSCNSGSWKLDGLMGWISTH
jgi:hypothetical protein